MTEEIQKLEFHAACLALPEQSEQEFTSLVDAIKLGWDDRHPILMYQGKILDGRHRYIASLQVGVTPTFSEWNGERFNWNPFRFVLVEHDARRNWQSQEQRHMVGKKLTGMADEFAGITAKIKDEANAARSEAAKGNDNAKKDKENSANTVSVSTVSEKKKAKPTGNKHNKGQAAKAATTGVNRGAVQRAEKLERLAAEMGMPEVADAVMAGKTKAYAALKDLEEKKKAADHARPVALTLPEGIHHGDFRTLSDSIADASIDLIFTDPPYDAGSVQLYEDAARIAKRILKPGGSLIAYSGQRHLPKVLAGMSNHLVYWWTIAGVHEGGNQIMNKLGIRCGWKPLVWFVKGTRADIQNVVMDVIRGDREKNAHEWQQAQSEAEYFIKELSTDQGCVVDFCLGGGTTAAACKSVGRKFIGFEVNASSLEKSIERVSA